MEKSGTPQKISEVSEKSATEIFLCQASCEHLASMPVTLDTVVATEQGILVIVLSFINLEELHFCASVCRLWSQSIDLTYVQWQQTSHWNVLWSNVPYLQIGYRVLQDIQHCFGMVKDYVPIIEDIKITPVDYADQVLKIALTKELKRVEWVEVEQISKTSEKSQASIQ